MARDREKKKFVVETSSEREEDEVPRERPRKVSRGLSSSGGVTVGSGSRGSARVESSRQASSSGRYSTCPHFHEEADQNSRHVSILHDVENLG